MTKTGVDLARELLAYCEAHPDQRFWQALTNWSGMVFVYAVPSLGSPQNDTWIWKGKGPNAEPVSPVTQQEGR